MTYFVTILKPLSPEISKKEFVRRMTSSSVAAYCSDPQFQPFREDGIAIVKKYSLPSGVFFTQIETSASDCK